MGSTDRLPEEGGRLLRTGRLKDRGLGRSTDILKVVFRRMSVIQTKRGIFDILQHIQRFIWRYPGLVLSHCFKCVRVFKVKVSPPRV